MAERSSTAAALRVVVLARSVYPLHGLGGLERHVFDLLRHHLRDGLRVTLITRTPTHALEQPLANAAWNALASHPGFSVRFVPYRTFPLAGRRGTTVLDRSTAYPLFGLRAGRLAAETVRQGGIDVVYGLGASAYGYALARRSGRARAPLVLNPQGLEEFGGADGRYGGRRLKSVGYAPLRRVVRACADAADVVIATDRALEPVVTARLHVQPPRLHTVPNGIDVTEIDALATPDDGRAVRMASGWPPDHVALLSVGRLERNKGFHVLARALSAWSQRPGWSWVIAGDGPYRTELARTIDSCGLTRVVRWLGRPADDRLHAWYEAADLFVHPTLYEGSSLVTLEAMAHRKPVVATRAGGLPDKVLPGTTGWLVPPGDPDALRDALDDAVAQRAEWAAMGAAGRALVEKTFDWSVIESQLVETYREVLSRMTAAASG